MTGTLAAVLRSDWIKSSSIRTNKVLFVLAALVAGLSSWASAVFVTDEALTVSEVFVWSSVLTAVFAATAGVLLFTAEAQHGTLAGALTAQPERWIIVASKAIVATGFGFVLGVTGMAFSVVGSFAGGLEMGDTSGMAANALGALVYATLAGLFGLGVGMVVRHSAAAVSGLLVWWMVVENLIRQVAPVRVSRFLPFDAGFRLLEMESDFDTPEMLAATLARPIYALVFGGYAIAAVAFGTVVLYRRDTN